MRRIREKAGSRPGIWIRLGILLLLLSVPAVGIAREVLKHQRDRALIAAIKKNDTQSVLRFLEQGADANTRDEPEEKLTVWQRLSAIFAWKRRPPTSTFTALLVLLEARPMGKRIRFNGQVVPDYVEPPQNDKILKALLDHGADPNEK